MTDINTTTPAFLAAFTMRGAAPIFALIKPTGMAGFDLEAFHHRLRAGEVLDSPVYALFTPGFASVMPVTPGMGQSTYGQPQMGVPPQFIRGFSVVCYYAETCGREDYPIEEHDINVRELLYSDPTIDSTLYFSDVESVIRYLVTNKLNLVDGNYVDGVFLPAYVYKSDSIQFGESTFSSPGVSRPGTGPGNW